MFKRAFPLVSSKRSKLYQLARSQVTAYKNHT